MQPNFNEPTDLGLCRDTYHRFADSLFQDKGVSNLRKYYAGRMADLAAFVEAAAGTDDRPFVLKINPDSSHSYHATQLANRYFKPIQEFVRLISILPTSYSYSEHIEIFREACAALALNNPSLIREDNWHPLTFSHPSGMDGAMCFNALCALLRRDWSAKGYKARFQRRVVETRNRTKEYCSYIDGWFAKLATLIVLRIDLSYRPELWETITLDDLRTDFDHLYNNARNNKIFRGRRGYIAKIEYGLGKGFHMHLILLFDTQHKQALRHIHLGELIGEYWKNVVTKGRGQYWNCNANSNKYDAWGKLGIGLVDTRDTKKLDNLKEHVISYLCKMDQFIRPLGVQGAQLIRRGERPKAEAKKRGAPRQRTMPTSQRRKRPEITGFAEAVDVLGY